jgi:ATP-dependent DNA helicase RecG
LKFFEIKSLLIHGETQQLECKESASDIKEIAKTITAFSNTDGGMLFLGVSDKGDIIGLSGNSDHIQQKIASVIQTIRPVPQVSIHVLSEESKVVFLLTAQTSSDYAYFTYKGAVYVRRGSTNQRLDGTTQLEYLRMRQFLSFDDAVNQEATINDIDVSKVQAYLDRRGQHSYLTTHSLESFLVSTHLAKSGEVLGIKNAALIFFAKNPIYFHPQAEVKLVKFIGKEAVKIASHRLLQTDLITAIDEAVQFIKDHSERSIEIGDSVKRLESYEYPAEAIREVLVNAIVHRDYFSYDSVQISLFSDRLEIISPGGFPRGMTKDIFGTVSIQRNPKIYRLLRDVDYVEGLGTGVPRINNAMRDAGLTDAVFIPMDYLFRVIFYNKKSSKKAISSHQDLNQRQKKALDYLNNYPSLKTAIYCELNGVSYHTAIMDINEMAAYGYLVKHGTYRGAYYVRA